MTGALLGRGHEYRLTLVDGGPAPVVRLEVRGRPVADLRIGSGCDADGQLDVLGALDGPHIDQDRGETAIVWHASTSLWQSVEYRFTCCADSLRFGYRVVGQGAVDRARYFCSALEDDTELWSVPRFDWLFNPEPTSKAKQRFAAGELARVGVGSDKAYQLGNWFFSPGPLCFVLETSGDDACVAVGVAEGRGRLGFTDFEALPSSQGGFGLGLTYEQHTVVAGEWSAPEVVLLPAAEPYAAVQRYCDWLRAERLAPNPGPRATPSWWREPMFCGWGEQVNQSVIAADACTQANYECWLGVLESRGVEPGTVVVDDKWQASYGENTFDVARWPTPHDFIRTQHARGRKVLLWLRAWSAEGLPSEECVVSPDGQLLACDPTHPGYQRRLRAAMQRMLLEYDADGFKLDFTHRIPVGRGVTTASGVWGVDLMHHLLTLVANTMRETKPDALLMAHTANPAFASVVDMLRLNDVPGITGQPKSYVLPMQHRARIARSAGPAWLIDTDNWPSPDRRSFLEYLDVQPSLGVPSLYFATGIRWKSPGETWVSQPSTKQTMPTSAASGPRIDARPDWPSGAMSNGLQSSRSVHADWRAARADGTST
ncbi:MAG: hypothetical protein M3069_21765 [Chloroflexota bacterium]|nr:hypothetical protein [Chloroflexota bacterium]